jgi:hypothetical protein
MKANNSLPMKLNFNFLEGLDASSLESSRLHLNFTNLGSTLGSISSPRGNLFVNFPHNPLSSSNYYSGEFDYTKFNLYSEFENEKPLFLSAKEEPGSEYIFNSY